MLISAQHGRFVSTHWLVLPTDKFGPEDADLIWGVDTEPDMVAFDLD